MKHGRMRGYSAIVTALLAVILTAGPANCWGPQGHTLITEHAVQLLPSQIKPFYEANARYIVAMSMLPDDWRSSYEETRPEHYCDLDMFDNPPFDKVRGSRSEVEAKLGAEKVLKMGVLPWAIEARFKKLVEAMRGGDAVDAVVQSALLAHYVGDAHVPLHATKNWDGCKPEHKGFHFRWETCLVALYLKPEMVKPLNPVDVTDVVKSAFDWLIESHSFMEKLCSAEDKARQADPTYAYNYYRVLSEETIQIASQRLTRAAEALAGVWIAAWEQAGKPDLSDKPAPLFWGK